MLPLSFRLIIFDAGLSIKESLNILVQNGQSSGATSFPVLATYLISAGIVSAPLWDSSSSTFAGLLTTSDYINVIQYYWQNPTKLSEIDRFTLNNLRGEVTLAYKNKTDSGWNRGRARYWCQAARNSRDRPREASLRSMSQDACIQSAADTLNLERQSDWSVDGDKCYNAIPHPQICRCQCPRYAKSTETLKQD